jgi:hypothetical protein
MLSTLPATPAHEQMPVEPSEQSAATLEPQAVSVNLLDRRGRKTIDLGLQLDER